MLSPASRAALKGSLKESRSSRDSNLLREDVGDGNGAVAELAQAQLVEYPQHHAGLLLGKRHRHPQIGAHELQEVGGGEGVGAGEAQLAQQGLAHQGIGGGRGQLRLGPAAVGQVVVKPGPLGGGGGGKGVAEGGGGGDGQAVAPGYPVLLAEKEEAEQGAGDSLLVGHALLGGDEVGVKGDGVDLPVGDEDLAVAVGDNAAGGLHRLRGGDLGGGAGPVLTAMDNLGVVEDAREEEEAEEEEAQEKAGAAVKAFFVGHGGNSLGVE